VPGNRETVTFLFTDIEGSTALLKRLRDEYAEILGQHQVLLRDAFGRHGGREVDTQGDSFFFAFRRARDAILAAVDGQHALLTHRWPEGGDVRVRMGMHTGEASAQNGRYTGVAVHRAARIGAAAFGGQMLLSESTHTIVHDEEEDLPELQFRDLGSKQLKGLDRAVRVYQVVAPGLRRDFPPIRTGVQRRTSRKRLLVAGVVALALVAGAAVAAVLLTGGGGKKAIPVPVPANSLVQIDPETNAPVRAVRVGRQPGPLVATRDAVWVANVGDRTLTRYDAKTHRTITVGGLPDIFGMASDGKGGVWVTTGGPRVVHVNGDGELVPEDSVRVPDGGTTGIALGDGSLWVTSPSDVPGASGRNTLTQISLKTRKPVRTWTVGDEPLFVVYGSDSAWTSNLHSGDVSVVTPGLPVRNVRIGGRPIGLALSGSDLWVGDYDEQKISKIDSTTLRPEAILPIGFGYLGVAADEKDVWVTNRNDGTVTRIDPRPGKEHVAATVRLGNCPQSVVTGKVGVWVSVDSQSKCY
jgi:class 3 adenylate cyclase